MRCGPRSRDVLGAPVGGPVDQGGVGVGDADVAAGDVACVGGLARIRPIWSPDHGAPDRLVIPAIYEATIAQLVETGLPANSIGVGRRAPGSGAWLRAGTGTARGRDRQAGTGTARDRDGAVPRQGGARPVQAGRWPGGPACAAGSGG